MIKIKNVKTGPSIEYGPKGAVTCTVYYCGMRVWAWSDYGNGGGSTFDVLNDKGAEMMIKWALAQSEFADEIAKHAEFVSKFEGNKGKDLQKFGAIHAVDNLIYVLLDKFEEDKQLKAKCRKKILVITKDCGEGEYYSFNMKFSAEAKKQILLKHDDIVEFINERY